METDVPNKRQDISNAHEESVSPHSQADTLFIKRLPLRSRQRSLENLPRVVKDISSVDGSSVKHLDTQLEEMEQSRAHESSVSAELEESKKHWQQLRKAYKKSRIRYENAIDPFGIQSDEVSATHTIAELRDRSINDRSLLESYAADVRRLQRKLQAAQSSRSSSELAFMQSARQWTRAPVSDALAEAAAPLDGTRTLPRTIVPSIPSPPEVNFLLERYHSKSAAVNSLGERLADHNYEYWNEVARRELLRDHEEALSVGDDEFEETSEQEKNDILQELSRTMEEADRLKADCISAGATVRDLEPIGSAFTYSHNLTNIGYGDSLQAALDRVPTDAFKDVEIVRADVSENGSAQSEPGKASQWVSSWVDDVSLDHDVESWSTSIL
jgi:hypothetical protein